MGKVFVIGDIHGAYRALIQCLDRSGFDKEHDTLITIGDIVDGWSEVDKVVDELLTIPNRVDIRGNHDEWFVEWLTHGVAHRIWTSQGGQATLSNYLSMIDNGEMEKFEKHKNFFHNQVYSYIDGKNRLFVHGGYNWHIPFKENSKDFVMWDRHAYTTACMWENWILTNPTEKPNYFKEFREVFVGHTATNYKVNWRVTPSLEPLHVSNLWNVDQGAGWSGKLSILNVDTKEFFQSDSVEDLYKDEVNSRLKK